MSEHTLADFLNMESINEFEIIREPKNIIIKWRKLNAMDFVYNSQTAIVSSMLPGQKTSEEYLSKESVIARNQRIQNEFAGFICDAVVSHNFTTKSLGECQDNEIPVKSALTDSEIFALGKEIMEVSVPELAAQYFQGVSVDDDAGGDERGSEDVAVEVAGDSDGEQHEGDGSTV